MREGEIFFRKPRGHLVFRVIDRVDDCLLRSVVVCVLSVVCLLLLPFIPTGSASIPFGFDANINNNIGVLASALVKGGGGGGKCTVRRCIVRSAEKIPIASLDAVHGKNSISD